LEAPILGLCPLCLSVLCLSLCLRICLRLRLRLQLRLRLKLRLKLRPRRSLLHRLKPHAVPLKRARGGRGEYVNHICSSASTSQPCRRRLGQRWC